MFKKIILSTLVASALQLTTLSLSAGHHKHGAEHELGLQLYSLRNEFPKDFEGTVKQIADWEIHHVEGGGMLHDQSIDDFKAALDKQNIKVVSVDTSYEEVRDNPIAVAYKAKYFGAKYATIYWASHDGSVGFTFDDAQRLVKILNEGGKLLAKEGVTLQYHPHGYEFGKHEDGTLLDYIIQNTEHAQFQMDVFWIKQGGADPVQVLQKYKGRFTSLHLKDRLKGSPNTTTGSADVQTNVVLGSGDVGIAEVIKEAKKQNIQYFFLEDESDRVISQIPQSIKFVKKHL
jgi:sugar phosphate isomerase/epimerase